MEEFFLFALFAVLRQVEPVVVVALETHEELAEVLVELEVVIAIEPVAVAEFEHGVAVVV